MSDLKIGVIVGSLSSTSINRKLAEAMKKLAPEGVSFTDISIDLPIYRQDFDADYPAEGRALKEAIEGADAILIVTPEYNRSIPGGLKNAIDWASRPWGQNSFKEKPVGVIGTSPSGIGAAIGQNALRPVLGFLNVAQFNATEVYLNFKDGLIDDNDDITNDGTKAFLAGYMKDFVAFAGHHKG